MICFQYLQCCVSAALCVQQFVSAGVLRFENKIDILALEDYEKRLLKLAIHGYEVNNTLTRLRTRLAELGALHLSSRLLTPC